VPLTTNETWTHGEPGQLWIFDRGKLQRTLRS
jgi:glutamine amidotransferase